MPLCVRSEALYSPLEKLLGTDDHRVTKGREDVRKVFQQRGSRAKRKLSRCRRNQTTNEPILALPEGADDFVVYYGAKQGFDSMLGKREKIARISCLIDVKLIEEDETQPILTMPNPNPINSNSPTVSPFLKDSTVHIPYTNVKTFADDVLLNHVGDEELKSFDGVGTRRMTEKEKNDKGMLKEPNKE
ncbi:hypothetical protein Tco_0853804 [Tanacetum coccineum]